MSEVLSEKFFSVVSENFPNGVRQDLIAENKFRRAFSEKYPGEEIPADLKIFDELKKFCVEYEGKFYAVSDSDRRDISDLIEKIFVEGDIIIFYAAIYEKRRDFFSAMNIFSAEILRQVMKTSDCKFFCGEDFCAMNEFLRPESLIREFCRTKFELSLEEIEKNFPYFPQDEIKKILANKKIFLKTRSGNYTLEENFQFDAEEIWAAREKISAEVDERGRAIFLAEDFQKTLELNKNLSEPVVFSVLYEKYFAVDYSKRGNLLTPKEKTLTAADLLKKFCESRRELDTKTLFAYAEECGISRKNIALRIAKKFMTRVSKNLFVRDSSVKFDVKGTDKVLADFVQGKIISLRDVNSFSLFPPIKNYDWNLYLLESFLAKRSKKFTFDSPRDSGSNIGAIYPKSMEFQNYMEVQAAALVQENIPLDHESVEDFLIGRGFRIRKLKTSDAEKIMNKAQEILSDK